MNQTLKVVPVTPEDYRHLAEKRLPRFLFDYLDGGANDERTLACNVDDFGRIKLRQRVLTNVDQIDQTSTLQGTPVTMPLALAPVGMAGLFARRGEVQAVRAANQAGVPFTLSTVGICSLEEVQAASSTPFWFQLYMIRDRRVIEDLLQRASANGCTTLVFTVDLPFPGMRHRDTRNGMSTPGLRGALTKARQLAARPGWIWDVGVKGKPHSFGNFTQAVPDANDLNTFKQWVDAQFDGSVTWRDIEWLRRIWKGKLVLKGIQEVEDAHEAVRVGADGLVVSNHGGRQLDSVAASISKLGAIVDAVGQQTEVLMDGGVRSGIDVFKALALGARGVLLGRAWAWALVAEGQTGVTAMLENMRSELRVAMALTGVTRVTDIGRQHIEW